MIMHFPGKACMNINKPHCLANKCNVIFCRCLHFQAFVTRFKLCEQNSFKGKPPLILEPLMYESYNPHEQIKYVYYD